MTVSLKHAFTSAKADGTDTTLIQPSNWNDEHVITLAAGKVLGRDTSAAGAVQELNIKVDPTGQAMTPPSGTTANRPATPTAGMFRYNTSLSRVELYNGSAWGSVGGGATVSGTAPSSPQTGDFWYDTSSSILKTWNGTAWVNPSAAASSVRQQFTATAGQTTFTVTGGYATGNVDVFQNGVKLVNGSDVTVTSGTAVVLATGASVGDIIEVIGIAAVGTAYLPLAGGTLSGSLSGTSASFSGTVADGSGTIRPLISGTTTSLSGLTVDLTGIPSWVSRITLAFVGASLSGSANTIVIVGTSSSWVTSGYTAVTGYVAAANSCSISSSTAGFVITGGTNANAFTGTMTLVHMGNNLWMSSHSGGINATYAISGGGYVPALGLPLTRLRIATSNGSDTFDAGYVQILYE